ncbi:MAG: hypothetical protein WC674_03875 [Candidatus Krumholzibacteriia bacterium]
MRRKAGIIGSASFILFVVSAGLSRPALAEKYVYPDYNQWIYCAEKAEECFLFCTSHGDCPKPDTMYIFIRAADSAGIMRAHFHLEWDYPGCDSILSVTPCPSVTIENGDILQGMTISFPLLKSGHFKAVMVILRNTSEQPPPAMSDYGFWIRDAWLERSNAQTVTVADHRTMPFYPDCYTTWPLWYHSDTVDVNIGARTDVWIRWSVEGAEPGMGGWPVNITDDMDWVSSTTLDNMWCTGCPTCAWQVETDYIYIDVPEGTPVGTLNTLAWSVGTGIYHDSLVLRAVPPIATEKQSWGKLKDLFK